MENGPGLKMYFLLKIAIFHCYVSLLEGTWENRAPKDWQVGSKSLGDVPGFNPIFLPGCFRVIMANPPAVGDLMGFHDPFD